MNCADGGHLHRVVTAHTALDELVLDAAKHRVQDRVPAQGGRGDVDGAPTYATMPDMLASPLAPAALGL